MYVAIIQTSTTQSQPFYLQCLEEAEQAESSGDVPLPPLQIVISIPFCLFLFSLYLYPLSAPFSFFSLSSFPLVEEMRYRSDALKLLRKMKRKSPLSMPSPSVKKSVVKKPRLALRSEFLDSDDSGSELGKLETSRNKAYRQEQKM